MSEKIEKAQAELEQKELLVQQIELEKREAYRKQETLEVQNFELQEKLTLAQIEAENAKKEAQDQLQLSMNNGLMLMDKTQKLLEEEDGIKLINTCDMQDMSVDDLRKSLGPS